METGTLASIITSDMINGVFVELKSLLPVLIPAMVSFIGIRKAIGFVSGVLHSA